MSEVHPKHLLLVRHGESEGDVRRSLVDQPLSDMLAKHPHDEEETPRGHEQSAATGQWIARFVLGVYGFDRFDWQRTSPLIRTKQSAESLGLSGKWIDEERLAERDRGKIQGMTKQQHQEQFPESYKQMQDYPFHWTPPGGESLLRVSMRLGELIDEFMNSDMTSGIFMTHRDVLWAAHIPLDHVPVNALQTINTDTLHNGHVVHYTNVDPETGEAHADNQLWKRSYAPWKDGPEIDSTEWLQY
jgi:broad specificity phosphatase PhoE